MPNTYRETAQLVTIEANPTQRGEEWSAAEIMFLVEFGEDTALELALALGRTEYGVENARQRLLAGELGGGRKVTKRPEKAYTFIGDDVPPGWND